MDTQSARYAVPVHYLAGANLNFETYERWYKASGAVSWQ